MKPSIARPHREAIRDLNAALGEMALAGVLIGGVAVTAIARARQTDDVDSLVVLDTARAGELAAVLEAHHFRPRFAGALEVARRSRIMAVIHEPTGIIVDIALGCMPLEEEVVARSTIHETPGLTLRLPTPEDLIILKAIANRPKDREDIRTIASVHPDVDRARIRRWVQEYAELLEEPGLWDEIEPLLGGV